MHVCVVLCAEVRDRQGTDAVSLQGHTLVSAQFYNFTLLHERSRRFPTWKWNVFLR